MMTMDWNVKRMSWEPKLRFWESKRGLGLYARLATASGELSMMSPSWFL